MNSMNATAITFAGTTSDSNIRRRSLKSLEILGRSEKVKRSRKRTSAIDSPSDLLVDSEKDDLLSVSCEDKKDCSVVLHEERFVMRFQKSNATLRYLYDKKETFNYALELFNRSHCHLANGGWRSSGYFFECKGPIRVVQRMCTRCRDCDKPRTKTDLYYVDLTEKHRERTIYCHGCMGRVLHQEVGTNIVRIEKQLMKYRRRQKSGIYIMSKGNQ